MTNLDPINIRIALTRHREKRTPWKKAWLDATGYQSNTTGTPDERLLLTFMEKHFSAAYHRSDGKAGRCRVDSTGPSGPAALPASAVFGGSGCCRSGAGCDRAATHGRFRPTFCEEHARELAALGDGFDLALSKADPRNGGNKSLYTHKAA